MSSRIPKVVHYCWFGKGQKPKKMQQCIKSWRRHLSDYEIKEWNEDNFEVKMNPFVQQAYDAGKYAFVSDYVRLHVLYHHGGIYMDTDVEVLKTLNGFLDNPAFTGFESNNFITTGIMGSIKGHLWIGELLDYYKNRNFLLANGRYDTTTNPQIITNITKEKFGLSLGNKMQTINEGLRLYPSEYFCPKNWMTEELNLTKNTHVIHHFAGSWLPKEVRFRIKAYGILVRTTKALIGERNLIRVKQVIKQRFLSN
jgi:mannosyltransferase OCH1-like enzyme